jgi:transposase
MKFIGIDIGKSNFVAAFPSTFGYQTKTYPNTVAGVRKFISAISPSEHHCVMEATGNYAYLLLYLLCQGGFAASLINPKQVKHFARMMMAVTKTDAKDACMLAMYGEKMNPPLYKMPSEAIIMLKQKKTVIRQLKKQLTATTNLCGSMMVLPHRDYLSIQTLNKTVSFLTRQIESMESELTNIAVSEFEKQIKALTSIKGIGITLATALIVSTGGFTYFENAKQLSRFIGICPTYYQSGTSINIHGRINRNGDTSLRSLLYVASWSASRHNTACRECYLRLKAAGKPSKVALIAVANKLVRQAFAIVTADSEYIDGFCSSLKTKLPIT